MLLGERKYELNAALGSQQQSLVTEANMKCPSKLGPPSPHVTSPFLPYLFWALGLPQSNSAKGPSSYDVRHISRLFDPLSLFHSCNLSVPVVCSPPLECGLVLSQFFKTASWVSRYTILKCFITVKKWLMNGFTYHESFLFHSTSD